MASVLERRSAVLVSLKVEVPTERVQQGLDTVYARLQRTARVRGFRPGKVPRHVVKQLLGKGVRQELAAELVQETLGLALAEHALQAVAVANVDAPPLVEGQSLKFTADVEVRPVIDAVDTTSLTIERAVEAVSDEDLDRELARLREQNAELVTPEPPRASATGDLVTFDMTVAVDGRERPDLAMRDSRAELGGQRLIDVIETALVGLAIGASREVDVPFADDHEDAALRGKSARCTVVLKTVQTKVLPELDDEFAKDVDHESLAALRASVRSRLEASAAERAAFQLREQVVERLTDRNPVAVPPTLVERQARAMLQEILQIQKMLGSSMGWNEEMQHDLHRRAERKVRAGLLLGALAKVEKIGVDDADVERKLQEIAERGGKHIAKVRAEHTEERLGLLRNQLLEEKLLELLLARATIHAAGSPEALAARAAAAPDASTETPDATPKKKPKTKAAKAETPSSETPARSAAKRPKGTSTKETEK